MAQWLIRLHNVGHNTLPLAQMANYANILATGEIGIEMWKGPVSHLILYEATGTWEGSKLYQGSETGRAQQGAGGTVKVPRGDSEKIRSYATEVAEDSLRTRITVV